MQRLAAARGRNAPPAAIAIDDAPPPRASAIRAAPTEPAAPLSKRVASNREQAARFDLLFVRKPSPRSRVPLSGDMLQNFPVSLKTSKVARMWSATAFTGELASEATTMASW